MAEINPQAEGAALSPISRRAFFGKVGRKGAAVAVLGAAALSAGCPEVGGNCGYCDGCGQDYEHCDGEVCTYTNYADGCF